MATVTRRLAALLGASGAGLTDSATASKITTDSINDDAVNAAKIAANAVGTSEVADNVLTATDLAANSVGESELSVDYTAQSVPHIIPGVLQPAVAGKLLNGANHSGAYGTPQTQSGGDGHSYYYTDIKGSKPIKDPRIGAHFGSQRHTFTSLQLLEQETATYGDDVFSLDGREWLRAVGSAWYMAYDTTGTYLRLNNSSYEFVEITGYFNDVNMFFHTSTDSPDAIDVFVDGTENATTNISAFKTTVNTPLGQRYVNSGSLHNIGLQSTSLGIHTIKLIMLDTGHTAYCRFSGIELIAQDLSGSGSPNRSKIQIPSQNVVSYGKKFEVGGTSAATHYDPFTTMSYGGSGTTLSALQSLIDTDTSLGMDAWKAGTSNYHRPWNGGRVIKWVDSSGTIKTSVNMMPPNAQNIGTTASNAVSDAHVIAGTNDDTINFNTSAIDHTQAEVAKTFHWREFGNGSANGGTGAGSWADASMLSGNNDDIAYVMDDGLSSLSATGVRENSDSLNQNANPSSVYIPFIGTGISEKSKGITHGGTDDYDYIVDGVIVETYNSTNSNSPAHKDIAQNLPYGTHILKIQRTTASFDSTYIKELTFHQPKRPPIPEDACVIADYMLMADYVPKTTNGTENISKGVRYSEGSRDVFFDSTHASTNSGLAVRAGYTSPGGLGWSVYNGVAGATHTFKQEFYGDGIVFNYWESSSTYRQQTFKLYIDDTLLTASNFSGVTVTSPYFTYNSSNGTFTQVSYVAGQYYVSIKGLTLGHHTLKYTHDSTNDTHQGKLSGFDIATPIHTSSHYQTFETPFLHELVGGDRNMEQHNLVVSPDGKTWDQLTRDTSYQTNLVVSASRDGGDGTGIWVYDWIRGTFEDNRNTAVQKKHWAKGYDRFICLIEGTYEITVNQYFAGQDGDLYVQKNDNTPTLAKSLSYSRTDPTNHTSFIIVSEHFKRGDYILTYVGGGTANGANTVYNAIQIKKV